VLLVGASIWAILPMSVSSAVVGESSRSALSV
jgi:hypothetical protein